MPPSSCPRRTGRRAAGASTTRCTCAPQIEHGLDEAGYGYWGFSPVEQPRRRLPRVRRRRARHEPGRLLLRPGERPNLRRRLRRLPRRHEPAPRTYGDGVVTPHAVVPRPAATRAARRSATSPAASSNFDAYGAGRLLRRGRRRTGTVARALPLARPGHGHGRARQRARQGRAAPGVQHAGRRAGAAARHRRSRSSAPGSSASEPPPRTRDACCRLGPAARVVPTADHASSTPTRGQRQ